jgi:hypothetical protein
VLAHCAELLSFQHQAHRERLAQLAHRRAAKAAAPRLCLAPQRLAAPLNRASGQISTTQARHGLYSAEPGQIRQAGPP